MYYVLYKDVQGYWRWTLYAANNRKIANSGEGYFNKQDACHAIDLVASSKGVQIFER
ncbi:DUF1508 domain-containing protein [Oceanicaulis sp. MMSF_3324]|uniref:YegP family protein n=1 Tax=Oceanicaulis sp. MMSF_3324 TaxID=3046702 RepID=UPI00273DCE00|nr:DUF1508 domain-containing protein [Oceanicaulis sp. MMSF_3324]